MSAKILIVDDHEIVRHGIRSLLERLRPDWQLCGEATNGEEAIAAAKTLAPDVVILDVTMPVMNGLQAAAEIDKLKTPCRLLVFTMHSSDRLIDEVRRVGAHGFVLKSQASRDLIAAIEKLLEGGTFFGSSESLRENETAQKKGPASSSLRATLSRERQEQLQALMLAVFGCTHVNSAQQILGHLKLFANIRGSKRSSAPVADTPFRRGGSWARFVCWS